MENYLGFLCGIEYNGEIWFPSFWENGLFKYDGNNTKYIGEFLGEEKDSLLLFGDVKVHKDNLFFIPAGANRIAYFDMIKKRFGNISYEDKVKDRTTLKARFVVSVTNNDFMYMFPAYYPGILKMNLNSKEIVIIDDWISKELEKCTISDDAYFRGDYIRQEETIYIPFCNAHAVLEFHLYDDTSIIHDVGTQSYSTIASDGEKFWMAPRAKGNIVCWNPITNEVKEYQKFPEKYRQGSFVGSCYSGDYVWMFPERANMVLKVNIHTGEIEEDKLFSDACETKFSQNSIWNTAFVCIRRLPDYVLLCTGKSSEVIEFYSDENRVVRNRLQLTGEDSKYYNPPLLNRYIEFRELKKGQLLHIEDEDYGIEELIEDIVTHGI